MLCPLSARLRLGRKVTLIPGSSVAVSGDSVGPSEDSVGPSEDAGGSSGTRWISPAMMRLFSRLASRSASSCSRREALCSLSSDMRALNPPGMSMASRAACRCASGGDFSRLASRSASSRAACRCASGGNRTYTMPPFLTLCNVPRDKRLRTAPLLSPVCRWPLDRNVGALQ